MEQVTAIVPHANRRDLLESLLENLASQTHPFAEVIVVDNGSSDDSARVAARAGARFVPLGSNLGFSRAVNCGVGHGRTPWVAVINNDVELDPAWLERLLAAAGGSDAWFATGKTFRRDGTGLLDGTWDALARSGCAWRCGADRADSEAWSRPRRIRFAPFTAVLLRREIFERVGDLDEGFESYLEDVEFGLRCAIAGLEGVYVPEAVARHRGSATLGVWHGETVRRIARNQLLLVARHYPGDWLLRCGWAVLVGQLLWGGVALRHGAFGAWLGGKREAVAGWKQNRRRSTAAGELYRILGASEDEIRRLQRQTGTDWYWKLYFALT